MITGHASFGPVAVEFDDHVLEPRPWTLAQSRRAAMRAMHRGPGPIIELHCGAGQIGLAAARWSGRSLVQVDDDPWCCDLAAANGRRNGVQSLIVRARVEELPLASGSGAVVIADPPYVPTAVTARYPDDHLHAIDGGDDGLEGVRASLDAAGALLSPGGYLELQVRGPEQARAVAALVATRPTSLDVVDMVAITSERALVELVRRARPDRRSPVRSRGRHASSDAGWQARGTPHVVAPPRLDRMLPPGRLAGTPVLDRVEEAAVASELFVFSVMANEPGPTGGAEVSPSFGTVDEARTPNGVRRDDVAVRSAPRRR
jgi:methylase of polypeptide subunit release factors